MNFNPLAFLATVTLATGAALATPISFLEMHSQTGDYIGQGRDYYFDGSKGAFAAQQDYFGNPTYLNRAVQVSYQEPGIGGQWWYLDFSSARLGRDLAPGDYTAQRFPFEVAGFAGLDVSGDGRGSNSLTGTFSILDLEFGQNGSVTRFAAEFEQHSEGRVPALIGRVSFNSEAFNPSVPEPTSVALFGLGLMTLVLAARRRKSPISLPV